MSVWLEVGRKDAHAPRKAKEITNGEVGTEVGKVRELQVYESWLRIETRLKGLRFVVFFPLFVWRSLISLSSFFLSYCLLSDICPHTI